jgi:anti-anti-sigma factor
LQVVAADGNTLRLVGDLDMETVALFEEAVAGSMAADGTFTLDLAELSFIDSSGLHALERHARALNGAAPLVINNAPAFARQLFEIIGLDKHDAIRLS